MSEKKSKLDSGAGGGENLAGWLVSYADMMTLVACFFILMMAFANYDPIGFAKKTEELAKSVNKDKFKSSESKFTQLQEEIARHPELIKMLKTSIVDNTLLMTFSGSALFAEDQYELTEEMRLTLDALIDLIKVKDSNFRVLVEGHTDNQPLKKTGPFTNNWALSGARASSVVQRFEYFGFDPKNLVALGLGDTRPIAANENEQGEPIPENIRLNRRVVIKVLEPQGGAKLVKMGLGVYFNEDNKGQE
jgi:chemotaxis protein MotB